MADSMREQIIHSLRMRGWSRIEAENEADERAARKQPLDDVDFDNESEANADASYAEPGEQA